MTYELLVSRCESMGVSPPSEEEFLSATGSQKMPTVSSPTEGLVVLDPPRVLSEVSGKEMDVVAHNPELEIRAEEDSVASTKKNKKNKSDA